MALYDHYQLRSTQFLLDQAEKLMCRLEQTKQIESGSGAGKSAAYALDSREEVEEQLDAVVFELKTRAENGDTAVPDAYKNIQENLTSQVADFSGRLTGSTTETEST